MFGEKVAGGFWIKTTLKHKHTRGKAVYIG